MIKFYGAEGRYAFLSTMYESPFELSGFLWPSVEHYYQASKAIDEATKMAILESETPYDAKVLGNHIKCRSDWRSKVGTERLWEIFSDEQGYLIECVRDHFMLAGVTQKFLQSEELKRALLNTGNSPLGEDSPYDTYWGVRGKNKTGRILQWVRKIVNGNVV